MPPELQMDARLLAKMATTAAPGSAAAAAVASSSSATTAAANAAASAATPSPFWDAALAELREAQAEALRVGDELNAARIARTAKATLTPIIVVVADATTSRSNTDCAANASSSASAAADDDGGKKVKVAGGAAAAVDLSRIFPRRDADSASAAAACARRSVYFPCVAFADDVLASVLAGMMARRAGAGGAVVVQRWALAPVATHHPQQGAGILHRQQQQQQQQARQLTCALVVELQSEEAASAFAGEFGVTGFTVAVGGPTTPHHQKVTYCAAGPRVASAAVDALLISASAFPLTAPDVRALFDSREADDCLRDLRVSLRI